MKQEPQDEDMVTLKLLRGPFHGQVVKVPAWLNSRNLNMECADPYGPTCRAHAIYNLRESGFMEYSGRKPA